MAAVIVIGARGHARVGIDVLRAAGHRVVGCLSHDGSGDARLDVPVLGLDSELESHIAGGTPNVFLGVGDNATRLALAARVRAAGGLLICAVSPHAVVAASAVVGPGTLVMPGAVVNAGARLGEVVIVNTNAGVDHDCILDDGVHVAPGAALAGDVHVGRGAFVGIGACVVPGIRIGDGAVVGAGATVVRDVAAGDTVTGVPARPVGRR
jgi:UDP-perosamine 4-acetyltransferase